MLKRLLFLLVFSSAAMASAGVHSDELIISDGKRVVMRGERSSLNEMMKRRKELGDQFFYFEHDGERYVVRDPAVVRRVLGMYEASTAAKLAHKGVRRRQRALAARERKLEREIDRIETALDDERAEQHALETRLRELETEAARLEGECDLLEAEEARYERERDVQQARADARVRSVIKQLIRSGAAAKLDD